MVLLKDYWDTETSLIYEFTLNGQQIKAGYPVRINGKNWFKFIRIVVEGDKEFFECLDLKTGKSRKFFAKQITGVGGKRSRL